MIYLLTIKTSFIGLEENFICHEKDNTYDIRSMDEIIERLSSYIGFYPTIEDIMEEYDIENEDEAYEEQINIIQNDISIEKKLASIEDLDNDIFYSSSLSYEEIKTYKEYLQREESINNLLS